MIKSDDKNKLVDLRTAKGTEFGVILEVTGDNSMIFCTTDKGYRLVLEGYNARQIFQHLKSLLAPSADKE